MTDLQCFLGQPQSRARDSQLQGRGASSSSRTTSPSAGSWEPTSYFLNKTPFFQSCDCTYCCRYRSHFPGSRRLCLAGRKQSGGLRTGPFSGGRGARCLWVTGQSSWDRGGEPQLQTAVSSTVSLRKKPLNFFNTKIPDFPNTTSHFKCSFPPTGESHIYISVHPSPPPAIKTGASTPHSKRRPTSHCRERANPQHTRFTFNLSASPTRPGTRHLALPQEQGSPQLGPGDVSVNPMEEAATRGWDPGDEGGAAVHAAPGRPGRPYHTLLGGRRGPHSGPISLRPHDIPAPTWCVAGEGRGPRSRVLVLMGS